MIERERKLPIQGLTLTEQLHQLDEQLRAEGLPVRTSVTMSDGMKDMEQRVITGEAATMGEALIQQLEERRLQELRHPTPERAGMEWIDCGTLQENEDGTYSIVDTETLRAAEARAKLTDSFQYKFWWAR